MSEGEGEVRLLVGSELEEAVRLADSVFRSDGRPSMGRSVPMVFDDSLGQSVGCFMDGKLVSFAGLVPYVIRVGAASLQVYAYGAVCTHPDYRGLGLARRVLQCAKWHAREAGASLLLVSGELPLYREAGCYPYGAVKRHRLTPANATVVAEAIAGSAGGSQPYGDESQLQLRGGLPHGDESKPQLHRGLLHGDESQLQLHGGSPHHTRQDSALTIRPMDSRDWFALHKLSAGRVVRYEASLWDLAHLYRAGAVASLRGRRHAAYVAERDGEPAAYCIAAVPPPSDSGSDEACQALAIDWAGSGADVAALLIHMLRAEKLDELDIPAAWHEQELLHLLLPAHTGDERNQGTVHVLDAEVLDRQLAPYWRDFGETPDASPAITELGGGQFELRLGREQPVRLDAGQLIDALFGGCKDQIAGQYGPWLPVPLPYTKGLQFV